MLHIFCVLLLEMFHSKFTHHSRTLQETVLYICSTTWWTSIYLATETSLTAHTHAH